eukprot:101100-Ditylum_brightwellii.AAC.1
MEMSSHLCIATCPFPQRRTRARIIIFELRSLLSRKMGKSGHLCFLVRSLFPQRSTRAWTT